MKRTAWPRCETCGHPITFHAMGERECSALGCDCTGYTGVSADAANHPLSTEDIAYLLDKAPATIRDTPRRYGGVKIRVRLEEGKSVGQAVWRFDPSSVVKALGGDLLDALAEWEGKKRLPTDMPAGLRDYLKAL